MTRSLLLILLVAAACSSPDETSPQPDAGADLGAEDAAADQHSGRDADPDAMDPADASPDLGSDLPVALPDISSDLEDAVADLSSDLEDAVADLSSPDAAPDLAAEDMASDLADGDMEEDPERDMDAPNPEEYAVAYLSQREGRGQIVVLGARSGLARELLPAGASARQIAWTPDASALVFAGVVGAQVGIYRAEIAMPGGAPQLITSALFARSSPSPGDAGDLYFAGQTSAMDAGDIYRLDAAGQLTRLTDHAAADAQPTWSSANQLIYFNSARSGGADVHTLDPVTLAVTRLTQAGGLLGRPAVSPDGGRLAYVINQQGTRRTRIIALPGGAELLSVAGCQEPAFLASGDNLLCVDVSPAGAVDVRLVTLLSGASRWLTQDALLDSSPVSSPTQIVLMAPGAP